MAAGAKPWSLLLLVALAAVMLIAARPSAADAAVAAPYADPYCSSKDLPPECTADKFSNCKYVPFPFSLIWPSCSLQVKATDCCDALRKKSEHKCATCALLMEFFDGYGVPKYFDPTKCTNGVQGPAQTCKDDCKDNSQDPKCKFQ